MAITIAATLFRAFYRYGRTSLCRLKRRQDPPRFLFAREAPDVVLNTYFPAEKIQSRNGVPGRWEFYTRWAPRLFLDRRARVYHAGNRLPDYIQNFCTRLRIEVEDLTRTRPDIPGSFLKVPPTAPKGSVGGERAIPDWFRAHPTPATRAALSSGKPVFIYMPWIAEHSDTLMGRLENDGYMLLPLDIFKDLEINQTRRAALKFSRTNPDLYRQMLVRRLVPMRSSIAALLVTFDWAPVMRIAVSVCQELGIPTILVPHESVFVDRDKYYWDPNAMGSMPLCDVVLGWGGLQKEIFIERGYPEERFKIVGAPKFDSYFNYQPMLTREQFCSLFNLDADRKIVLFASQPLDSQLDAAVALDAQRAAIADLLSYCEARNTQLIVRLPPSRDDILGPSLRNSLLQTSNGAVDDAICYLVNPEEALFHCDVVASINSTMLFEGLLHGRCALSMKYVEFDQIWERAGIPVARSLDEAEPLLDRMLAGEWQRDEVGMQWAAERFGIGTFDGMAAARIRDFLTAVGSGGVTIEPRPNAVQRLLSREAIDVGVIASNQKVLGSLQFFLPKLLNVRTLGSSRSRNLSQMASGEVFFQWGNTETPAKTYQRSVARSLGRPVVILEDGFIRSIGIGLSGEPTLSVIIDDTTAYYDATRQSWLERELQEGRDLDAAERQRARLAIDLVVRSRVSKYNHAPDMPLSIGRPGKPKVLVVDQRYGDQAIASALADASSFERMLRDAITDNPDHDVVVKVHPDAIGGGKSGYFDAGLPQVPEASRHRVFLLGEDCNPYALIDLAEAVYVVSSGMGFEALMAGRTVHCYGAPYYSGWGVTIDHVPVPRRTRRRSVEEIFYHAYILASRYVNPETNERVEVEDLVDYIVRKKAGYAAGMLASGSRPRRRKK